MTRSFPVQLTCMCLIRNQRNEVLIQDRQKKDWPGWTFPGGHVEATESMTEAVIREIKEETGLIIAPKLMGIAEWLNKSDGSRELCGIFLAQVTTEPTVMTEGRLFWLPEKELSQVKLAGTLSDVLPVFYGEKTQYFQDNRF
ncbi:8-oxo-dGTP diphosphatase [Enterococcus dispar]|uniref:8-oxo-dGTP diphosphatase n=1 Tax=Enterococcus dispar TaxID=44009 RepID=UPI0021D42A4E|nr:NUDIX domain-containing protein [Enterococcus dispar]MCU7357605.1 NUDIX domain-containing protein [Enterococcus dispar]MDT2706388.1 NUDIX domain-containing protein [Enterococcus dispar]WCG34281.1 NUDIX domain-containing protein [Enterococcus dispar]